MDASRVLLFVVSRETRSLSSMALAAHYIGLGCNLVLCIQRLPDNAEINGDRVGWWPKKNSQSKNSNNHRLLLFSFTIHMTHKCFSFFLGRDQLSAFAIKDYNRGRNYLSDLANREGIPVFDEVKEAVECAIQRCLQHNQQTQTQQQQRWKLIQLSVFVFFSPLLSDFFVVFINYF